MKIQSLLLAGLFSLVGTTAIYSTAFADTTASVTATCKDGTSFSGASKKGACSGHKGVKTWGDAAAPAAAPVAAAPVAVPAKTAATPAAPAKAAKPAAATTAPAAGGGAGQVWVNSDSKVYHCSGTRYYGKTKTGSYMSEAAAKAQGNRPDHGKACS